MKPTRFSLRITRNLTHKTSELQARSARKNNTTPITREHRLGYCPVKEQPLLMLYVGKIIVHESVEVTVFLHPPGVLLCRADANKKEHHSYKGCHFRPETAFSHIFTCFFKSFFNHSPPRRAHASLIAALISSVFPGKGMEDN